MTRTRVDQSLDEDVSDSGSDEEVILDSESVISPVSPAVMGAAANVSDTPVVRRRTNYLPVYKWEIHYDGKSDLIPFLERIEELRVARGASSEALFQSAIDLFKGDALSWFRSARNSVSSWDELVGLLRRDFLAPDYDDVIWEEIRNRRHRKGETFREHLRCRNGKFI